MMLDIPVRVREQMSVLIREGKDDETVEAMTGVPRRRVEEYRFRSRTVRKTGRPVEEKTLEPLGYSRRHDWRPEAREGSDKLLAALQMAGVRP